MKSITIHKLDSDLAKSLEERAKQEGTSLNRTIKTILKSALGLDKPIPVNHRKDFEELFGSWSKEEGKRFESRIADKREINPDDWER